MFPSKAVSLIHNLPSLVKWEGRRGRWGFAIGTGTLGLGYKHTSSNGHDLPQYPAVVARGMLDEYVSLCLSLWKSHLSEEAKKILLGVEQFTLALREHWSACPVHHRCPGAKHFIVQSCRGGLSPVMGSQSALQGTILSLIASLPSSAIYWSW